MSERALARGCDVLGGAVALDDLFPPGWMAEHTEYADVESFLADASAPDDRRGPRDDHVASATAFDDWAEMVGRALDDYRERRTSPLAD